MNQDLDLEAVADACMDANQVIQQHGTPEMLTLIRHLLFVVGRELATRGRMTREPEDLKDG